MGLVMLGTSWGHPRLQSSSRKLKLSMGSTPFTPGSQLCIYEPETEQAAVCEPSQESFNQLGCGKWGQEFKDPSLSTSSKAEGTRLSARRRAG